MSGSRSHHSFTRILLLSLTTPLTPPPPLFEVVTPPPRCVVVVVVVCGDERRPQTPRRHTEDSTPQTHRLLHTTQTQNNSSQLKRHSTARSSRTQATRLHTTPHTTPHRMALAPQTPHGYKTHKAHTHKRRSTHPPKAVWAALINVLSFFFLVFFFLLVSAFPE